jgi:hypothetical protein
MTSTPLANQMLVYLKRGVRYRTILGENFEHDIPCDPPLTVKADGWYQVTQRETGTRPHIWKVR